MEIFQGIIRWFLVVLPASLCFGQVLPANRAVDWTVAGLNDTSTVGFTYFNVLQEGAIADGVTPVNPVVDSLLALNLPVGIHLHFPSGNYFFNESITLPSHCLITGEGAEATQFVFDLGGSGHAIQTSGNVVNADSSSLNLAGVVGEKTLSVVNAAWCVPGMWIRLVQNDSNLVTSSWALKSVGQLVRIDSITGNTLHLHSPLRLNYPLNRSPRVVHVQMKRNIGLACFGMERIDYTAPEQASGIHFTFAENCWISGIKSNKTTFGHIEFEAVSNAKVEKCYCYDAFDYGGGGRGYGVVLQFTTNECLIENNIFKHLRHSILFQAGANGNVVAFNHSTDPYWTNANPILGGNSAGELVLHGNYVYANLFEQNDVQNIVIDNSHGGNGPYNTFLRNRASLYGIFFSDNTSPSQNFIGNEIPNTGFPYSAVNYNILGNDQFTYGNNNKGTVAPAGTSNVSDISYYYANKPAFVQDYQWGKIGLPHAMNTTKVPATDRFEGNALFAGACGSEDFYAGLEEAWSEGVLYPNPAQDYVILPVLESHARYQIIDLTGKVWNQGVLGSSGRVSLETLPAGMYIVQVAAQTYRLVRAAE